MAEEQDELVKSLSNLFTNASSMVKGELQGTNGKLLLLEKMNNRITDEYNHFGDIASGLGVYLEKLNEKNNNFEEYVHQIDAIDRQVKEFEAAASMLDKYVSLLEKKVIPAYETLKSDE